jgi:hypothetical protein
MEKCSTPVTKFKQFNFFVPPTDALKPPSTAASNRIDLNDVNAHYEDPRLLGPPDVAVTSKRPPDPGVIETFKWPPDPGVVETSKWPPDPGVVETSMGPPDPGVIETFKWPPDPGVVETSKWLPDPGVVQTFKWPPDPGVVETFKWPHPGVVETSKWPPDPGVVETSKWTPDLGEVETFVWATDPGCYLLFVWAKQNYDSSGGLRFRSTFLCALFMARLEHMQKGAVQFIQEPFQRCLQNSLPASLEIVQRATAQAYKSVKTSDDLPIPRCSYEQQPWLSHAPTHGPCQRVCEGVLRYWCC